ncbi:helix-turn-helix domain-containing protein [Bacillus wiedmannii]|uniref:helix-turn-helix domain-containing protein n=1 Tax=Bacillus wiedmannii TaxID=1890302 RepID=UPI0021CFA01C|nr:helix-turn-helix transcriptional regulator [Bacillus wiedmannii]MCU5332006.1 helix-turn-helix transcriptional regulator [Bacillus wiedmannii]
MIGLRLKSLRKKENLTQKQVAEKIGVSQRMIGYYESEERFPPHDVLTKLADCFSVSADYLLGRDVTDETKKHLTPKNEKDIAKRMEEIKKDLQGEDGLMFSGEPMSQEAVESLLDAMEYIVKQTKVINKKYVPKKYRKPDDI